MRENCFFSHYQWFFFLLQDLRANMTVFAWTHLEVSPAIVRKDSQDLDARRMLMSASRIPATMRARVLMILGRSDVFVCQVSE